MSSVWVVNASPLISLARVGQLVLLEMPGRVLHVPEAVAREVLAGPVSDPSRQALEAGFGGTPTSTTIDLRVDSVPVKRACCPMRCRSARPPCSTTEGQGPLLAYSASA